MRRGVPRSLTLTGLVVACLAALAVLAWRTRGDAARAVIPAEGQQGLLLERPDHDPAARAPEARDASATARPSQNGEEFLREYFGDRAAVVRQRLEQDESFAGIDWSAVPPPVAWEEAEAYFQATMIELTPTEDAAYVDNLTRGSANDPGWLRRQFAQRELSDEEVADLQRLCAPVQAQLDAIAGPMPEMLRDARRRKWSTGDFLRAPYGTRAVIDETQPRSGTGVWSSGSSHGGWAVSMRVDAEDIPGWAEFTSELVRLRNERQRLLTAWRLANKPR
jgi:hypothetical protein